MRGVKGPWRFDTSSGCGSLLSVVLIVTPPAFLDENLPMMLSIFCVCARTPVSLLFVLVGDTTHFVSIATQKAQTFTFRWT